MNARRIAVTLGILILAALSLFPINNRVKRAGQLEERSRLQAEMTRKYTKLIQEESRILDVIIDGAFIKEEGLLEQLLLEKGRLLRLHDEIEEVPIPLMKGVELQKRIEELQSRVSNEISRRQRE